ncbi:MAG TPA: type IX secretion system sortase PorU, partial [Bacteroidales bacterium]|nr:type IX secretion system sortase PorU [Bacteroidales bacterium]
MRRIFPEATFLLLLLSVCLYSKGSGDSYSSTSVLASGQWLKVAVTKDGVYKIEYSLLKKNGMQDPLNPRIFSNNAGQLSYYNDGTATDDLKEIAIYTFTGSDGTFNEGDYILFYGSATGRWKYDSAKNQYNYQRHNYSDSAFYFITNGSTPAGKKILAYPEPPAAANYSSSSSDALFWYEVEKENLIKSGRDWFEKVPASGIRLNTGFSELITAEPLRITVRTAARSSSVSGFSLNEGSVIRKEMVLPSVNLFNTTGIFASVADSSWLLTVASPSPSFILKFNDKGNAGATGWIDYASIQGRVRNVFAGTFTTLRDYRSVSAGRITAFSVESGTYNPVIWDITDPCNVKSIGYTKNGSNIIYKSRTDSLRAFVAFLPENAWVPSVSSSFVPNQDLHSSAPAQMIIITHPIFRKYAEELAEIHFADNGITSQVVTTAQVYNEFSGGTPDIAALRNFVRMKYLKQKGTSAPLKYLLLFGDGSFENRTPPPGNPNFIPTYQSRNSNVVVSSFTSDDFYGLLDDGEGEAEGTEDIGIGRFPVTDTTQARNILTKIRRYLDPANMGDWRNVITLTADDEDGNAHMADAEGLDLVLKQKAPEYNVRKIYMDAFRQVTAVNGQSYPDVTKAINERINEGCLIFNFTGHGNEAYLAHERIVRTEDYMSWKNGGKLPLFITATCEFSRFDDVEMNVLGNISEKTSAGEMILLEPEGGAIALMSTTRVVFSAPNFFLNRNIFSCAFERDSDGNSMTLGDIIKIAKNNSGSGSNKRNFSLLGDPALRLAYPWHGKVLTDSINHVAVTSGTDSLKALSMVTVAGHIEDFRGKPASDFSGIVSPIVFDKESTIRTLANDGGPVMEFKLRNNIIFSGQTKAKNGNFIFSFIVPRDIDYSFGEGKISYYAHDDSRDMNGAFSDVIVGGFSDAASADTSGPVIRLFMNDTL